MNMIKEQSSCLNTQPCKHVIANTSLAVNQDEAIFTG